MFIIVLTVSQRGCVRCEISIPIFQARAAGFYRPANKYRRAPVAVVALSGVANQDIVSNKETYQCDGFTESIVLYSFNEVDQLRQFLGTGRAFTQLTDPKGFGVALLTYSAVLSRGITETQVQSVSMLQCVFL